MNIESEAVRIQAFVERGNYHAAYNLALSGLNACHRDGCQQGVERFLEIIRGIVDSLASEFGGESR